MAPRWRSRGWLLAAWALGAAVRAQDDSGGGSDSCDGNMCGDYGTCRAVDALRYECDCLACWNGRRCNIPTVSQSCAPPPPAAAGVTVPIGLVILVVLVCACGTLALGFTFLRWRRTDPARPPDPEHSVRRTGSTEDVLDGLEVPEDGPWETREEYEEALDHMALTIELEEAERERRASEVSAEGSEPSRASEASAHAGSVAASWASEEAPPVAGGGGAAGESQSSSPWPRPNSSGSAGSGSSGRAVVAAPFDRSYYAATREQTLAHQQAAAAGEVAAGDGETAAGEPRGRGGRPPPAGAGGGRPGGPRPRPKALARERRSP